MTNALAAWLLLLGSQATDSLSTARALKNGAKEVNPLFGALDFRDLVMLKILVLIAVGGILILFPHKHKLPPVVAGLALLVFAIALWNWFQ